MLEVHVWSVELSAPADRIAEAAGLLSPDETTRALKFRFERLRQRFVLARAVLRTLLGRCLDADPAHIEFLYGPRGKPSLAPPDAHLRFNLSHSGNIALYAVAEGCEVGIDVEEIRPVDHMEQIAARFFCAAEAAALAQVDPEHRVEAFFNCWTRKEAYLKATGDGLSAPLSGFQVTLKPGEPARFVDFAGDRNAAAAWALHHLDPLPGYAGALALCDPRPVRMHALVSASELLAAR